MAAQQPSAYSTGDTVRGTQSTLFGERNTVILTGTPPLAVPKQIAAGQRLPLFVGRTEMLGYGNTENTVRGPLTTLCGQAGM